MEKKGWSISIKLWIAMTMLILVVLGGLGTAISWLFSDFYLDQKLDTMEEETANLADQMNALPSLADRRLHLQTVTLAAGTQLVLISNAGDILLSVGQLTGMAEATVADWLFQGKAGDDRGTLGGGLSISGGLIGGWSDWVLGPKITDFFDYNDLQEVVAGNIKKIKAVPKRGSLYTQAMLITACPIGAPADGVILLATSPTSAQESIHAFQRIIMYISLLAVVLTAIVSLFFARQMTRPLALMHKGAARMAKGDFEPIEGIESKDELGELAEALNRMGESLKSHMTQLSQQKDLLQEIIEGMSDAVIMLGTDGALVYANDPAQALWSEGGRIHEERRQHILSFIHTRAEEQENESRPSDQDYPDMATLTLGRQILAIAIEPIGKSDDVEGYVAVLRDVTASLRAEKSRRDFLASVTHELRTPLHLIQGYLEAIQDGVVPSGQQTEYIDLVLEETGRLARLVQGLQDINKLEAGSALHPELVDLGDLMKDVEYRFQQRAKELEINFAVLPASGQIMADRDRLLQVFINLIDNAFRHTPKGRSVRIGIEAAGDRYRIAIQDEGEGIPDDALGQIFDRFYRVDKARTRKDGGMGLGLAIVKQIVEAHGGKVWATSVVGKGSIFWVELPRQMEIDA